MRLTDLDPKWLTLDGRRVGFIFRSPTNREWWQTCFVEQFKLFKGQGPMMEDGWGTVDSQDGIVKASAPEVGDNWQSCNEKCGWVIAGGIKNATFETMSVTPSLDGSRGGLWHGYIKNGEINGGL